MSSAKLPGAQGATGRSMVRHRCRRDARSTQARDRSGVTGWRPSSLSCSDASTVDPSESRISDRSYVEASEQKRVLGLLPVTAERSHACVERASRRYRCLTIARPVAPVSAGEPRRRTADFPSDLGRL